MSRLNIKKAKKEQRNTKIKSFFQVLSYINIVLNLIVVAIKLSRLF